MEVPKIMTTQPFRVSFHSLFEKTAYADGKPSFHVTMLFPKEKLKTDPKYQQMWKDLNAMVNAAIRKMWPDGKPDTFRSPFTDGNSKKYDGYAGMIAVKATSKTRKPKVVDQNMQEIISADEMYNGCYAMASITCYAYKIGTPGVAFGLQNVQKYADGEPFGFASKVEDDFAPVDSVDPALAASESDILSTGGSMLDDNDVVEDDLLS
ncbi:DUF2815 family protein [Candidatus Pacearchaeota archaeon]|nr:DUF2815 family protein [Candidatus Pacearchaeota archaeon]